MSFEAAIEKLAGSMERLAAAIEGSEFVVGGVFEPAAAEPTAEKPKRGRPKKDEPAQAAPVESPEPPAAPVAPAPAAPAAAGEVTIEAIRAACAQYAKANGGKDAVLKVLQEVGGVGKVADLPAEKYAVVHAALTAEGDF